VKNLLFTGNAIDGGKQVIGDLSTQRVEDRIAGILIGTAKDGWVDWTPIEPKSLRFFGDMPGG